MAETETIIAVMDLEVTQLIKKLDLVEEEISDLAESGDKQLREMIEDSVSSAGELKTAVAASATELQKLLRAGADTTEEVKELIKARKAAGRELQGNIGLAHKLLSVTKDIAKTEGDVTPVPAIETRGRGVVEGAPRVAVQAEFVVPAEQQKKLQDLLTITETLLRRDEEAATDFGTALKSLYASFAQGPQIGGLEKANKELDILIRKAKDILSGFEKGDTQIVDEANLETANIKLQELEKRAGEFVRVFSVEGRQKGEELREQIAAIREQLALTGNEKAYIKNINAAVTSTNAWSKANKQIVNEVKVLAETDFEKDLNLGQAEIQADSLRSKLELMINSTKGAAVGLGTQFAEELFAAENATNKSGAEIRKEIGKINTEVNKTIRNIPGLREEMKQLALTPIEGDALMGDVEVALRGFNAQFKEILDTGNEEGIRLAQLFDDRVTEGLNNAGTSAEIMISAIKEGRTSLRGLVRDFPELQEEINETNKQVTALTPLDIALRAKKAETEIKKFRTLMAQMMNSTNANVRSTAMEFDRLGNEMIDALSGGDKEAEEVIRALKAMRTVANDNAKTFDRSFGRAERGAKSAQVQIWKLGTAMDRVGVRSASGILRVVDAMKQLGPAAIAGGLAVGAIIFAVVKLTQAVFELGKIAAKAFAQFTKGSVETSKRLEILDRQFQGLLRGSQTLAKELREVILGLSFEFGQDLTSDFSRLLVPMAKNVDQIERVARQVAEIAVFRGMTADAVSAIIAQAVSGQEKGLKQSLKFTQAEIRNLKNLQEEYGNLEGTIMGVQRFLDRRGFDFDKISDSMAVAQGRLEAFRVQVEDALGAPIKDELGEFFGDIAEFIERNKDVILSFFDDIGEGIASVIEGGQSLIEGVIGDITPEDIRELGAEFEILGESVKGLLETLGSADFKSVIDGITGIVDAMANVTRGASRVAAIRETIRLDIEAGGGLAFGGPLGPGAEAELLLLQRWGEFLTQGFDAKIGKSEAGKAYWDAFVKQSLAEKDRVQDILDDITSIERTGEAVAGGRGGDPRKAILDQRDLDRELGISEALAAMEASEGDAQDAQEKINEAILEADEDLADKRAKLVVDMERKLLKLEKDFSDKRIDAAEKFKLKIRDLLIDFRIKVRELEIDGNQKEADIATDHARRLEDAAEDQADKIIDIEKKFQEKLADIRRKFDFDAQEAIRQNDAVALLRIRRRMRFELNEAKLDRDKQTEEANDDAKDKRRDIAKWLKREIEDAELAEKRKLEDLIRANGDKAAELHRHFLDELKEIDKQEKRKADELDRWRKWEEEDIDTWWRNHLRDLERNLQNEYDLIRKYKDLQLDYARAINTQIATSMAIGFGGAGLMPGIPTFTPGGHITGGTQFGGTQFPTSIGNPPPVPGSTVTEPQTITPVTAAALYQTALDLANQLNMPDTFLRLLNDVKQSQSQLLTLYNQLLNYRPGDAIPHLAHGGRLGIGQLGVVGERGPEPFMPTQAGIVAGRDALRFPTSPANGGGNTFDNSTSVQADLSMLDPSKISPIQQTIIRGIVTDVILNIPAGG